MAGTQESESRDKRFNRRYKKGNTPQSSTKQVVVEKSSNFENTLFFAFIKGVLVENGALDIRVTKQQVFNEHKKYYYITFYCFGRDRVMILRQSKFPRTAVEKVRLIKENSTCAEILVKNFKDAEIMKQCQKIVVKRVKNLAVGAEAEQKFEKFLEKIIDSLFVLKSGRRSTNIEDRDQGFDFLFLGDFGNGVSFCLKIDVKNKPTPYWSHEDKVKQFYYDKKNNVYEIATFDWNSPSNFKKNGLPVFPLIIQKILQDCIDEV